MEKVKSKFAIVFTILFAAMLSLFGCGDPYKNMQLTTDAEYNETTGQYYKDIVMDDTTTSFTLSATVSGMAKGVSSDVSFVVTSVDTPNPISLDTSKIVKRGDTTTASFNIHSGGQSVVEVITSEGPNGGLRQKVYINIIREVQSIDFVENINQQPLYIERGAYLDLTEHLIYEPSEPTQKDVVLTSVTDIVGGQASDVTIVNNSLYIAPTSTINNFTLNIESASNDAIVASVPVIVVDLMQEENIILMTYDADSDSYTALGKNSDDKYTITLANNTNITEYFKKNIYFGYKNTDTFVTDEYTLFVETQDLTHMDYNYCSVDILDEGMETRYATVQQITTGTNTVRFGFVYKYATGLEIKYVDLVVNVIIFPTRISATNSGAELDETNPYLVYDSNVVQTGYEAFYVNVYGVDDNVLLGDTGRFYLSVKKDEGDTDSKVNIYDKYNRLVLPTDAVSASSAPFYVKQSYSNVDEIAGSYYVEITSAIAEANVIKTFPLKFIKSDMDISCEENVSLQVNSVATLVINGLGDLEENLDKITISNYDTNLISVAWNTENPGEVLITSNSMQGATTIIFTAPNGKQCSCIVTVFDEFESAEVKLMGHTIVAKAEDEIVEEDILTLNVANDQIIQLEYNINGEGFSSTINDAMDCVILSPDSNVVSAVSNNRLSVKNVSDKVLITITLTGYDDLGSMNKTLQVKFYINVVVLVSGTRYTQSYSAYSNDNNIDQTIQKVIEASYTTLPTTATITTDNVKWNVQVGTYNGILSYDYEGDYYSFSDDISNSGASSISIDTESGTKTYVYEISGNLVRFVLSLNDCKKITTYATLSTTSTLTYSATASITQNYIDVYGQNKTSINNGTRFEFTIKGITLVDSITITNLPIENDQYMLTFDNREVNFDTQINNEKAIYVNVGPTNAVNKNLTYTFNIDNASEYFDVRIENIGTTDYSKIIYVKIKKSINESDLPSIRMTIKSTDGSINGWASLGIRLLDGSYANPYLVSTPEDLDKIRGGLASHYLLTSDIDLTYYIAKYYRNTGWEPIGTSQNPFTGSLRGQYTIGTTTYSHIIKGLKISQLWLSEQGVYAGLFGAIKSGYHLENGNVIPTISNIELQNVSISVSVADMEMSLNVYVGALVGQVLSNGQGNVLVLENIYVNDGAINTDELMSVNNYGISYTSSSNYKTTTYIGGVAGYMEQSYNANISAVVSMDIGDNSSESNENILYVGGIAGYLESAKIENNSSTSIRVNQYDSILVAKAFSDVNSITNTNTSIGGIVGYNNGTIQSFTTRAYITGYNNIGGAVGINAGVISNVTSTVYALYGNNYIGGLVGRDATLAKQVSATVFDNIVEMTSTNYKVGDNNTHIYGNSYLGGLIGSTNGNTFVANNGVYAYVDDNGKNILSTSSQNDIYLGGLIGADYYSVGAMISNANINNNFVKISITHASSEVNNVYIGGLVGYVNQVIENITYNDNATLGTIDISTSDTSLYKVEDFVGYATSATAGNITINNSYSIMGEALSTSGNNVTISYNNTYDFSKSISLQSDYDNFIQNISVYTVDDTNDIDGNGFNDNDSDLANTYGNSVWYKYSNIMQFTNGVTVDLPVQIKTTRTIGNNEYFVNLVINLVPTDIVMEKNDVWVGDNVLTVVNTSTNETSYALQYFKIDPTMYSAGIIKGASEELTRQIEDYVNGLNVYPLDNIVSLYALPKFLNSTNIKLVSNNPTVLDIVYNSSGNAQLVTKGVGVASIVAYSIYDNSVQSAPIEITVLGGQSTDFSVTCDNSLYFDGHIEITKGINEQLHISNSNSLVYKYGENNSQSISVKLEQYNEFGAKFETDNLQGNSILVSGQELTVNSALQIDNIASTITVKGVNAAEDNGITTIVITPYIKLDDNTYVYLNTNDTVDLKVINGTQGIHIKDNVSAISIEPWTEKTFDVVIDTDNRNEILYFDLQHGLLDFDNSAGYFTYFVKLDNGQYKLFENENQIQSIDSGFTSIYLDSAYFDVSNGTIVYTFRIALNRDKLLNTATDAVGATYEVAQSLSFDTNDVNNIRFYTKNRVNNEIAYSTNMSITLFTQEMSDSSVNNTYYPYAQVDLQNNVESYVPDESSSDTIVVGRVGLMNISVRPIYANVDHFEITSTNNLITFAQLYRDDQLVSIGNDGEEHNGYRYIRTLNDQMGTYGQILNKLSNYISASPNYDDIGYNYSGNIYVYTLLGNLTNPIDTITITLYGLDKNNNVVYTKDIVMKVVETPRLSLTYQGRETGVIARGTTTTFTGMKYAFDSEIQFTNSYITDKNGNTIRQNVLGNGITINRSGENTYSLYADIDIREGSIIVVQGYVAKVIEGKLIEAHASLKMRVVQYVVDSISINNVVNGNFVGLFGQNYPLEIHPNATYNDRLYYSLENGAIATLGYNLSDYFTQSGDYANTTKYQYYAGNNKYEDILLDKLYSGFAVSQIDRNIDGTLYSLLGVRNKVITTTDRIQATCAIYYDENGIPAKAQDLTNDPNKIAYTFVFTLEFGFKCYKSSENEHPEPIFNEEGFLEAMSQGTTDYILMNDITLSNWQPVATNISSLDGNGYVIRVESFDLSNILTTDANIGVFSSIPEGTVIKNIILEVLPKNDDKNNEIAVSTDDIKDGITINKDFDLVVDATNFESVNFGLLAGTNEGSITNATITYNAKELKEMRDDIIGQNNTYREYDNVSSRNSAFMRVIANTSSVTAYMGALVGVNGGYITNSAVEDVSILGVGYVGGLVGQNNNSVASSYFSGGNIQNQSTGLTNTGTAGLVAINNGGATIDYSYVVGRFEYPEFNYTEDSAGQRTYYTSFAVNSDKDRVGLYNYETRKSAVKTQDITGLEPDYKKLFVGTNYDQLTDLSLVSYRAINSAVSSNTPSAGFVYSNSGKITNSYSNILVNGSSSPAAGFVYTNTQSGEITETYSMSSVKINSVTNSPFTGQTADNTYNNEGSIENSHYLKLQEETIQEKQNDTVLSYTDEFFDGTIVGTGDEAEYVYYEYADAINASQFANYTTFAGYAFNEDFEENDMITTSVWFIPTYSDVDNNNEPLLNKYKTYFKNSSYIAGRPELVSANLKTVSIRVFDEEQNAQDVTTNYYQYASEVVGESISNPYLIYNAKTFDEMLSNINSTDTGSITYYTRMISDISYMTSENVDGQTVNNYITCNTYKIDYTGVLDGNNMTVSNLRLVADRDNENQDSSNIEKLGLFASITSKYDENDNLLSRGVVKNINIDVSSVNGTGVQYIGTLAGVVDNGSVYNVNVTSSANAILQGNHIVGGAIGLVKGDSEIVNVTSSVSATAYYKSSVNEYNHNKTDAEITSYYSYYNDGEKDNVNQVSYTGGVIGVADVNERQISGQSARIFSARIRKLSAYGNITLTGENVGGVVGYVGTSSAISNSTFTITSGATPTFVASRASGGIAAENHGTIDRCYVEHDNALQQSIDNYFYNSRNTTYPFSTSNYVDLFGKSTTIGATTQNAHYIGGLVGINIGGVVENSYSKVTVYNHDSLVAGGLVGYSLGGSIESSYATGSVASSRFVGGLVGLIVNVNRLYNSNTSNANIQNDVYMYISNINNFEDETKEKTNNSFNGYISTKIEGGIAQNIWRKSDFERNGKIAFYSFGSFVGGIYEYEKPADAQEGVIAQAIEVPNTTTRKINETNYTVQMLGAESPNEIGNIDYASDEIKTGGVQYESDVSGSTTYHLYKNLMRYSSSRTYNEFVSRRLVYEGSNAWSNQKWEIINSSGSQGQIGNSINLTEFKEIGTESRIYKSFSTMYWEGISPTLVGNDGFITPSIKQETFRNVINVYTEDDLKQIYEFLDSEFVLCNDIELTELWEPVGTMTEPFTGILRSYSPDTIYTIKNVEILSQQENTGFFGVISGATLKDFNLQFNSLEVIENNGKNNVGSLVAYISAKSTRSFITNIAIDYNDGSGENAINMTATNPLSIGGAIGVAQNAYIDNLSANNVNIQATYTNKYFEFNSDELNGGTLELGVGGLIGVANNDRTKVESTEQTKSIGKAMYYGKMTAKDGSVTVNLNGLANQSALNVGGLIGAMNTTKVVDFNGDIYGGLYANKEYLAENQEINIKSIINSTETEEDKVENNLSGLYVGGVLAKYNSNDAATEEYSNAVEFGIGTGTNISVDMNYINCPTYIGGIIGYTDMSGEIDNTTTTQNVNNIDTQFSGGYENINITVTGQDSQNDEGQGDISIGGFAGYVSANIKDITLKNVAINTKSNYFNSNVNIGGFAGRANGYGLQNINIIKNNDSKALSIQSNTTISKIGIAYIGGIVGYNNGTLLDSITSTGIIEETTTTTHSGSVYYGGLVGYITSTNNTDDSESVSTKDTDSESTNSYNTYLQNSATDVTITSRKNATSIGGAVGYSEMSNISQIIASGSINNYNKNATATIGGVVGTLSNGTVSSVVSNTNIISYCAQGYIAPMIGNMYGGTVEYSYSTGYIDLTNVDYTNLNNISLFVSGKVLKERIVLSYCYTVSRLFGNITKYYDESYGRITSSSKGVYYSLTKCYYAKELSPNFATDSRGKKLNEIMSNTNMFGSDIKQYIFVENKLPTLNWIDNANQNIKDFEKTQDVYKVLSNNLGSSDNISDLQNKIVIANGYNIYSLSTFSKYTYIIGVNQISGPYNNGHIFDAQNVNIGTNNGVIDYVTTGTTSVTVNNGTIYRVVSIDNTGDYSFCTTNNGVIAEVDVTNQKIDEDSVYKNSIFKNPNQDGKNYIATTSTSDAAEAIRELTSFDPVEIMQYNINYPSAYYHTYDLSNVFYSVMNSDATYSMPQLRWTLKSSIFNNDIESKYYWLPDNIQDNIDFTVDSNRIITVKSGKGLIFALLVNNQFEKIVLGNDIDLSGKLIRNLNIILRKPFDGQGYTIKNMTVASNSSEAGLINVLSNTTFENVLFENGYVYANSYTGIIGVVDRGIVQNVANDNVTIIASNGMIGGLVGLSTNSTIQYSYVVSQRKQGDYLSNLFGTNIGSIAGVVENSIINQVYSRFMNVPSFYNMTGNNEFTAVHSLFSRESFGTSINTLRTGDLGFDWNYVWARDNSISQPRNDGFPILQFQYAYWIEIGKEAVRGIDYEISGNNIYIITEKGLAWLSYITSSQEAFDEANTGLSNIALSGYTVNLLAMEFDMAGALWSPIGMAQGFAGTMLGIGNTIKNLHITGSYSLDTNPPNTGENTENLNSNLAFVQKLVNDGVLVDIVFENAVVNGKDNLAVVVSTMSGGQINGTDVINSTIIGTGSNISACVAKLDNTFTNSVASCAIANTNILIAGTGSEHIGGVVGFSSNMSNNVTSSIQNIVLTKVNIIVTSSAKNIGGILGGGQLQNIYRSNIKNLTINSTSSCYVGLIAGNFDGYESEINQNYITSSKLNTSRDKTNGGLLGTTRGVVLGENILINSTINCAQIIGEVSDDVEVYNFYSSGTTNTAPYAEGEPSLQSLVLGPNFGSNANAENFVGAVNTSDYAALYYNSWWEIIAGINIPDVIEPKSLSNGNANIDVAELQTTIENYNDWVAVSKRVQLRYLEEPVFNINMTYNLQIDGLNSNILGKSVYPFSGTFLGQNNTITLNIATQNDGGFEVTSGITRTNNQYLGLFGNTKNLTISYTKFVIHNKLEILSSSFRHVSPIVAFNYNEGRQPVLSNCSIIMDDIIENTRNNNVAIGSAIGTVLLSSPTLRSEPLQNVTIDVVGVVSNKASMTGLYIGTYNHALQYYGGGFSKSLSAALVNPDYVTELSYDSQVGVPNDTQYGRIYVDDYFKTNVITDIGLNPNSSSEITFDFDTNSKVAYLKFGQSLTLDSPGANSAWYTYSRKLSSNKVTVTSNDYNIRVYRVKNNQITSVDYTEYGGIINASRIYDTSMDIWPGRLLSKQMDVTITTTRAIYVASDYGLVYPDGIVRYPYQLDSKLTYPSQTHKYKADYYQFGRSGEFVYNGITYTGIPYYMYNTNSSAQTRPGTSAPTYSLTPRAMYYVYSTTITLSQSFNTTFKGLNSNDMYTSKSVLCVNVYDALDYKPSVVGYKSDKFLYWYFTHSNVMYKSTDINIRTLGALINKARYDFGIESPTIYAFYSNTMLVKITVTTTPDYIAWGERTFNIVLTDATKDYIRDPEDLTEFVENELPGAEMIVNKTDKGTFYAWAVTNNDTGQTVTTPNLGDALSGGGNYTVKALYR